MEKNKTNILKFKVKPKEILSTDEILKVFSGLIRLVQKSAEYTAQEQVKDKLNYYITKLNETTVLLNKRNKQIEELLELNNDLMASISENNGKLL